MADKKVAHKQSKYLTIMLIPDSSAKVKSIKIPHWCFGVCGSLLFCVICVTVLFRTQVGRLENMLGHSSVQLEEALEEKKEIESEKSKLLTAFENEKVQLIDEYNELASEKETVKHKLDSFEDEIIKLQNKSEEIDSLKRDIVKVLKEFDGLGLPVSFNEDLLNAGIIPMGGAYDTGNDITLGLLEEFNECFSRDVNDMKVLKSAVESLLPCIDARPIGWPVTSRKVTSEFGLRKNPFGGTSTEKHSGIDIQSSYGSDVKATADGIVTFAGWNGNGYGYLVTIEHEYGYSTYYAHNSRVLVEEGDSVTRGTIIALSGNSGRSSGPHCHYEVRLINVPQNPWGYLKN